MLMWWCTRPLSSRTSPLRPACTRSSSSSRPPTSFATTSIRSLLFVALRNGVGMYTVTAMLPSPGLSTLTQVTLARIGKHGDDELRRLELRRDGARGKRRRARGDADEQPLLAREPPRPRDRVLVTHLDDPVDDVAVEDARHERRSDALDRVGVRLAAGEHGRLVGLDGDHTHAGNFFLQHLADARQRAPGADAHDECVQTPLGRLEDLERRRPPVRRRVGGVLELLRHEPVGVLAQEFPRRVHRARHSLERRRQVELRAEPCQEPLALDRRTPRSSAASSMATAIRSLTLPPGFTDSSLATTVAPPGRGSRFRRN